MRREAAVREILKNGFQHFTTFSVEEQSNLVVWAGRVVEQYKRVLNKYPARLKHTVLLPCSKQELKLAIKVLIMPHIARDAQESMQWYKYAYISLATFQEADADDRHAFAEGSGDISYQKYLDIALAEQNTLVDEIDSFVADIKQVQPSN